MRTFANVSVAADSFYSWLNKTNDVLTAFAETVTVKGNTAGDMSTGNGFVTGILGANTITATNMRGGNVTTSSVLTFVSNTNVGNLTSQQFLTINDISQTKSSNYVSSNTDAQILDTFTVAQFRSGKYIFNVTSGATYQFTEIAVMQDATTVYTTEYASLYATSPLATFSANINAGTVRLFVTPVNAITTFKYQRDLLAV